MRTELTTYIMETVRSEDFKMTDNLKRLLRTHVNNLNPEDASCSICLEVYGIKKLVITKCAHIFHKECIEKVRGKKCPICRAELKYEEI